MQAPDHQDGTFIPAELDYEVYMLEVQTAFFNADVEEERFVKIPPGYERSNESGVPLVMNLKKSLYGLRQSPKNWLGTTVDHHLGKIGFRSLKSYPCVNVYEDESGSAILTSFALSNRTRASTSTRTRTAQLS